MSDRADNAYLNARAALNGAMADYIIAAQAIGADQQAIGADQQAIANDVNDSLCDASERDIIIADTTIK